MKYADRFKRREGAGEASNEKENENPPEIPKLKTRIFYE